MPFYRINGMNVHVRGSKHLPPPCSASAGLLASDGVCAAPSGYQCDWDIGKGLTCDRHLCTDHAHQFGRNKHYGPAHRQQHLDQQPQARLFTNLVKA